MSYKDKKDPEIKGTGKFILDNINEDELPEYEYEGETALDVVSKPQTQLVAADPDKEVILVNNKKYEVYPISKLPAPFESKLQMGMDVLDDDYVYKVNPETGALVYKPTFELPEDFNDASPEDKLVLAANYVSGLVPYKEKKLTKKTMPNPLLKGVYYRLATAAAAMLIATLVYIYGASTWHIFLLAGIYSFVYLWNAAISFYYAKTRNFKIFSGIVTNVSQSMAWSPSLRKTYLQISNGKKFMAVEYRLKNKKDIKIGTPVTVFVPNNVKLTEGPLGPTADVVLGISFSLDIKTADKYGEYQDGRMQDTMVNDFFEDAD